jgi:hypothetical protein
MNSKKAKLMRKYGKVDKKTKRGYNSLSHDEKGLLGDIYKFNIERKKYPVEE